MVNVANVFETIINRAKEENERIKDVIVESVIPSEDMPGLWQVRHTITEIIESLQYDLYLEGVIEKK